MKHKNSAMYDGRDVFAPETSEPRPRAQHRHSAAHRVAKGSATFRVEARHAGSEGHHVSGTELKAHRPIGAIRTINDSTLS